MVADGRWAPSNFPTFTIADSEIAWDWATSSSNYETLRLAKEAVYKGAGWQIESSLELSQYTIQQTLLNSAEYDPTGGYLALPAADAGAPTDGGAVDSSTGDAATGDAASGGDASGDDAGESAGDAGAQANAASADLAVLFAGITQPNVRITRMRSDVAQSALSVNMILGASTDQSELTNVHVAQQQIGEPECPVYSSATCAQIGTAPRSQAQADAALASAGGSSGCSTTRPENDMKTTLGVLFALGGVTAFRIRRKRRASRG